jgi:hypothetical protein
MNINKIIIHSYKHDQEHGNVLPDLKQHASGVDAIVTKLCVLFSLGVFLSFVRRNCNAAASFFCFLSAYICKQISIWCFLHRMPALAARDLSAFRAGGGGGGGGQ